MLIRRAQGFTLVELVLLVLLIAVLTTVAVDQWPGSGINLSAQADQLVNDGSGVTSTSCAGVIQAIP